MYIYDLVKYNDRGIKTKFDNNFFISISSWVGTIHLRKGTPTNKSIRKNKIYILL